MNHFKSTLLKSHMDYFSDSILVFTIILQSLFNLNYCLFKWEIIILKHFSIITYILRCTIVTHSSVYFSQKHHGWELIYRFKIIIRILIYFSHVGSLSLDNFLRPERYHPAGNHTHSGQPQSESWKRRPHAGLLRSREHFLS